VIIANTRPRKTPAHRWAFLSPLVIEWKIDLEFDFRLAQVGTNNDRWRLSIDAAFRLNRNDVLSALMDSIIFSAPPHPRQQPFPHRHPTR